MNLFITFLFGLTILIGVLFILVSKNNKRIVEISISMAFSILLFLIFFELIPEVREHLDIIYLVLGTMAGVCLLKLLDVFIPSHEHSSSFNHVLHISLITSIALILHNIIEGMALYISLKNDIHMGLLLGFGIGLHNIPMGMVIASTLKEAKYSNIKIIILSFIISLSTLLGGFIICLFNNVSTFTIGIMLALTLGMIIYIIFFELLDHLFHQERKNNIIGIIIGIIIFLISLLFHSH